MLEEPLVWTVIEIVDMFVRRTDEIAPTLGHNGANPSLGDGGYNHVNQSFWITDDYASKPKYTTGGPACENLLRSGAG